MAALVSPVAKLRIQHTRDIVNYDLTFTCSHTCAKCISSLIPDFENFLILPFKHIILSHTANNQLVHCLDEKYLGNLLLFRQIILYKRWQGHDHSLFMTKTDDRKQCILMPAIVHKNMQFL